MFLTLGKKIQRKGAETQSAQRFCVWVVRLPQTLRQAPNHFDFPSRPLHLCAFALDFKNLAEVAA